MALRRGRVWVALAALAAVAAVALVLLLQGGSSNALADAAGRMEGENMRIKLVMGMTDASGTYSITGEGVVAADNSRGVMDMTVDFENETFDMEIRNIGDQYWFRSPQFRSFMPRGKPWVHSVDRATPATTLSPSEFARFLAEADDVDEVGEEDVQGQPTTHYSGVVDLEELADEIGGESKERLEAAIEQADPKPGQKVGLPVDAWISRDGLPLRMRIYAQGSPNSFDAKADVLEYGVEVDVKPPPGDAVIEEAEFNRLTG